MQARRSQLKNGAAIGVLALILMTSAANANPADGTVSAGAATISSAQPGKLTIDQQTKIVIIDWNSFNIAKGETTTFNQPGSDATAVNRIGGQDPAKILGNLNANGRVILIDGNGILFGKNAQVNVGSLLATTSNASNADILSGKATFDQAGNPNARIVNNGHITATSGMVGLVAPSVVNNGVIVARLGQVTLGASNVFTVDFNGDGLISFPADPSIIADALDRNGKPVKALVANNGKIEGQTVLLSARAAAQLVTNVISVKGEIVARSIDEKGGHIILDAGAGSIALAGASLDATGAKGGGDITVGSATAASVTVDAKSVLDASATTSGNGGAITVNSQNTAFHGAAKATGGATSGNGGQIETSGEVLNIDNAAIDTSAVNGITGGWLLDPFNVTISTAATSGGALASNTFTPSGNSSVINATTLLTALASNNVTVTTGSSGSQAGTLTVSTALTWSSASTLTLTAAGAIAINANISAANGGLYLSAGTFDPNSFTGTPAAITATGGIVVNTFTLGQGNWLQNSATLPVFTARNFSIDPNTWGYGTLTGSFIRVTGGSGSAGSPYQIADVYGLMGIGFSSATTALNYKLVNNIDASGLADFMSIGTDTTPDNFTGVLDGQNFTLSNLTSTGSANGMAGLFGWNMAGTVKNLTLANVTIGGANAVSSGAVAAQVGVQGNGNITNVSVVGGTVFGTLDAGGLVGANATAGTITGSSAIGVGVTQSAATLSSTRDAGGLVGQNQGTITQSYATGAVTAVKQAGGLVGLNIGTISKSYATGAVFLSPISGSPGAVSMGAGGLVGVNVVGPSAGGGVISQSYALGSVTLNNANAAAVPIGSFVGANGGTITEAYGAGDLAFTTGSATLGGFSGANTAVNQATQTKTGTLTNTYYDTLTTGQTAQSGGLSTTALQGTLPTGFNTLAGGIWATGTGLYPYLASFGVPQTVSGIAYKDAGTVTDGSSNLGVVPVSLTIGGVAKGTVNTGANGYYYFQLPAGTISGGATVVAATTANVTTGAVTASNSTTASASISGLDIKLVNTIAGTVYSDYGVSALGNANVKEVMLSGGAAIATATSNATTGAYSLNAPGSSGTVLLFLDNSNGKFANTIASYAGASLTGVNLYAGYLNFYNTAAVTVSAALSQLSGFSAPTGGFSASDFLFSGTAPAAGLAISSTSATGFTVDSALSFAGTNGLAVKTTASDLYVAAPVSLANGNLTLDSLRNVNVSANLTVIGAGKVVLKTNDGGTGGDYLFYNGKSLQFTGTVNSGQALTINGTAYTLLYSVANVQAMSLTGNNALAKSLDATGITGYVPPGTPSSLSNGYVSSESVSGLFEGLGNTISNLAISTSGKLATGFIAYLSGSMRDFGLVGGSVASTSDPSFASTGGLVGYLTGNIAYSYTSAAVSSNNGYTGGMSGRTSGNISSSYATGTVTSSQGYIGGLVGWQTGANLTDVYATGNVSGSGTKGGLIGASNTGTLTNAFASGQAANGLIGTIQSSPTITNAYWDTTSSGTNTSAGGTGLTTAQLQAGPAGLNSGNWKTASSVYPYLNWQVPPTPPPTISGTVYSDYGATVLAGATVYELSVLQGLNGNSATTVASAISAADGSYSILAPTVGGRYVLFLDGGSVFANTVVSWGGGNLTGADLYGSYLHFYNMPINDLASSISTLNNFFVQTPLYNSADFLFATTGGGPKPTANVAVTFAGGYYLNTYQNLGSGTLAIRDTSGTVTMSNYLVVAKLLLLGNATYSLNGVGTSYSQIGVLAANTGSPISVNAANLTVGTVNGVAGVTSTGAVTLTSASSLTIASGAKVTSGAGTNVVLSAATAFINNQGSDAVAAGNRWLVYSANVSGDTFGNLDSGNTAVWGSTLATMPTVSASGNRYVFGTAQKVTFTTVDLYKVYGTVVNESNSFTVSGLATGVTGAFLGDTLATATTGTFSVLNAQPATAAFFPVGNQQLIPQAGGIAALNGYTWTVVNTGYLRITPAPLTVTLTGGISKTYDGTSAATLSAGNFVLSGVLNNDPILLTAPTIGSYDTANAGTGKTITVTGLSVAAPSYTPALTNYTLVSTSVSGTIGIITPKALSVSLTGNISKTYDQTNAATLTFANYALSGVLSGDTVSLATLPTTGTYSSQNVGTGLNVTSANGITITGASSSNYTVATSASGAALGAIVQKALSISLTGSVNKTYDTGIAATLSAANYSLGGIVSGDTVSVVNTAGTYDTKTVGTGKTVTVAGVTLTGAQANNYYLPAANVSGAVGAISAATLSATLSGLVEKNFDGTTAATVPAQNLGLTGVLGSDTVSITGGGSASYDTANAGTGKTVTVTSLGLTGADAGNYQLASNSVAAAVGKIDPALVAVTIYGKLAGTVSKQYDGTTTATLTGANYVIEGLVAGSTNVALNNPTTGTYDNANAGSGKIITVTGLAIVAGGDSANYVLSATSITGAIGIITPKTLTASFNGVIGKVYDGSTVASVSSAQLALSGVINNDNVSLGSLSGFYDTKDAGAAKTVTVSGLVLGGTAAGNYVLSSNSLSAAAGAITAKTLTATLTGPVEKTYDGGTVATVGTGLLSLNGVISGDNAVLTGPTSASFDTQHAGSGKTVTVNGLTISGAQASDYQLASATIGAAVGIIDPKALSVSLTGTPTKTYDGTDAISLSAANLSLSGIIGQDAVTAAATSGSYDNANSGTGKTVSASGLSLTGAASSDYFLTGTSVSANTGIINPKSVTYAVADTGSSYGTLAVVGAATLTGLVAADAGNVSGTVGVYDGGNNPVALSANTNAGAYTEKVTGLTGSQAANYVLAGSGNTNGTLTVSPLVLITTYTVADASSTYGTLASLGAVTLNGVLLADSANVTGTVGVFNGANVQQTLSATLAAGAYSEQVTALSGSAANNYVLATSGNTNGTLTVMPKALTASLTGSVSKTYDGTTSATLSASNYSLSGLVGTDSVSVAAAQASFDTANAGAGKTITATGLALNGAAGSNYTLTGASITGAIGTITQKALTASLTGSVSKTYDGTTAATLSASNYSLSGLVGMDSVSVAATQTSFDTANAGAGKTITATGLALAGSSSANYTLFSSTASGSVGIINPALLTVTANNASRSTGAPNPAFTITVTGLIGSDTAAVLTGVVATSAGIDAPVGNYAITTDGGAAVNYAVGTRVNGVLSVTAPAVTADIPGLNNALPASKTNYNGSSVSLNDLIAGKIAPEITGASGSLVCDVANNDASAESCHSGGGQAVLPHATRVGQAAPWPGRAVAR